MVRGRNDVARRLDGVRDAGRRVAETTEGPERGDHADGECDGDADPQPAGRTRTAFTDDPGLERVQESCARLGPLRAKLPLEPVTVSTEPLHVDPFLKPRLEPQVSAL